MHELLQDAFHRPSAKLYGRVTTVVWILILTSIGLLLQEIALGRDFAGAWALDALDDAVVFLFIIELFLRVGSYQPADLEFYNLSTAGKVQAHIMGKLRFCLRPLVMVDILTVIATVPVLRGLRALRLLRLLRSGQVFKYSNPFAGIARAYEENWLLYLFGSFVLSGSVLIGGLSFYLTERVENEGITHVSDGFWWAIVTVTTVGYGDLSPVTPAGKLVAGVLMIAGMIMLALFAGIVGSTLLQTVLTMREEAFRMSNYVGHILLCGFEPGSRMLLDTLASEFDLDLNEVVIFAPYDRPHDIPAEFIWIQGDPTKESELAKARVGHASAVILVGSRSELPQAADARTILTAFTVRRYLAREAPANRKRPVYLVAEILDAENVPHAKTAGADEVIETTRMGFSLMAHAVEVHGTATILGELADVSGHSLFVGICPVAGPFVEVAHMLKESHGIMLLGVRGEAGKDSLNPPDDLPVAEGQGVVYLGQGPVLTPV